MYIIGLDIGVASVGWAAFECDEGGEPCRLLDFGSRIFAAAEQPKTGASLAVPRRAARSIRRLTRRRAHRIERVRYLVAGAFGDGVVVKAEGNKEDIFALRVKGLDNALSAEELCRVLVYFVKHRGYKSNGKSQGGDDDGKVLSATESNRKKMEEKGYSTIGEMIFCDGDFSSVIDGRKVYSVRNKNGAYDKCFLRADLRNEAEKILERQVSLGVVDGNFKEAYLSIFDSQRSFDEGPALPSKYRIENYPVGACAFYPDEERAPKAAYTAEYCTALQKINNLRVYDGGREYPLSAEQRQTLMAQIKIKKELTFAQVKRLLALPEEATFNLLNYSTGKKGRAGKSIAEIEKARFIAMAGSYQIRSCLNEKISGNIALLDNLAVILSHCKSDEKRLECIKGDQLCACLSEGEIEKLLEVDCKGFAALSLKAMAELIPHLEEGYKYNEACDRAGFDFRAHSSNNKLKLLRGEDINKIINEIKSPVVRRAASQTLKVINALVLRYGSPCGVNIELARGLAKNFEERASIKRENDERAADYDRLAAKLQSEFSLIKVRPRDVLKYRLYEEQGGKCAYSGKTIDAARLFSDENYAQIDHIIPYSRSFDDSYSNKVLVLSAENQNKGNRLPLEYFAGDEEKVERFKAFVNAQYQDISQRKKRKNLLREQFTEENEREWKERSLNDTKYATRLMYNLIRDYLEIVPINGKKKQVRAVNGAITYYLRKFWGLKKDRGEGDKHHAQDAAVIACTTDGMIQRVTKYNKIKEYGGVWDEDKQIYLYPDGDGVLLEEDEYDSKYGYIKEPYQGFRTEIQFRLMENPKEYLSVNETLLIRLGYTHEDCLNIKPIFVSRMPNRKADGAIHEDTIRSARALENGVSVLKTPLESLKLDKNGEIEGYYEKAKKDDRLLYDALKKRLADFGGDGKKAFAEPFYKPKADGTDGPRVKKVLLAKPFNAGFRFSDGKAVAANGGMVRTDVFIKDGKYYCVPVYIKDIYARHLPNRAIAANENYKNWTVIDASFTFLFALFPNDLIYLKSKKPFNLTATDKENKQVIQLTEGFFYYKGINISSGAATIITHDNSYATSIGLKTLPLIEKYEVGVLGDIHKVTSEKRLNTEWDT